MRKHLTAIDLIWFVPITVCLATSAVLAYHGVDGWGWFLVASLFLIPSHKEGEE